MTGTDNSFPLRIWSGLFKKKHWEQMGQAIWLFGMLIDKVTAEDDGKGYVLGGKPITFADLSKEMPISTRQFQRLMDILRKHKYISTRRTPSGLIIVVNKSKKFKPRRLDNNGGSPPTDQPISSERSDKTGTTDQTKKADAYIDNTVDIKETKKEVIPDFQKLWERIFGVFKLPEDSITGYKSQLLETITRLGIDKSIAATEEFLKIAEDHPPAGKIKSITDFLHWKKIDLYVAMLPDTIKWRFYSCPECIHTIRVDATKVSPLMLELPSMMCHEEQRHEVTKIVENCKKQDFNPEQILVVLNKHFNK